jgi:DMSO/TMAO reductase YedYZ molybdopterin-dependent catalytic subunit
VSAFATVPVVEPISFEELDLAARNHGMPLEALRYPITPIGLHYLLTHYDIPAVDPRRWRLSVGGVVERPLELSLDELRSRPAVELIATMECAGNGRALLERRPLSQPWLHGAVGTGRWRGVLLRALLDEAGIAEEGVEVVFSGLDRGFENGEPQTFARSLTVAQALDEGAILAYELDGRPLPPQHGFPLRLVVPGWYGMTNVKWLSAIEVVGKPFTGHQQLGAYRIWTDDGDTDGVSLTRMLPRALMTPPGVPDFPTRRRTLAPGPCTIEGRAWSGWGPIDSVSVSTDAGRTWSEAAIEHDVDSQWAWSRWTFDWDATPGEHELRCRARDAAGNVQPDEAIWNRGGYANNAVQRVPITVAG